MAYLNGPLSTGAGRAYAARGAARITTLQPDGNLRLDRRAPVPRVSHGNLTANTEAIIRSQHLRDDERAMLILPLSYCFGASVFHTHLYHGRRGRV